MIATFTIGSRGPAPPSCCSMDQHVGVVIEESGHFVAEEAESTLCDHIVRFLGA